MKKLITAVLTILALFLSALILTIAFNSEFNSHGIHTWFVNSDSLYIPLISTDLLQHGPSVLSNWFLTPNPYYVPDMLIGMISSASTGAAILPSITVYAWIQFALLGLLLRFMWTSLIPKQLPERPNDRATSSILSSLLMASLTCLVLAMTMSLLIVLDNSRPGLITALGLKASLLNLLTLGPLNSGHHFSVVLMLLLCLPLALINRNHRLIVNGQPQWRTVLLSGLAAAGLAVFVASDIFIALWFSAPLLLSETIRRSRSPVTIKRWIHGLFNQAPFPSTLLGSVAGYIMFKTTNPGYDAAFKPEITPIHISNSLGNQLQFFSNNASYYFLVVPLCCALVFAYLIQRQRQQPQRAIHLPWFLAWQLLIGFALPVLTAQFPTSHDASWNSAIFRYTMILAMVPLIAFGLAVAALAQRLVTACGHLVQQHQPTKPLILSVVAGSIAGLLITSSALANQISSLRAHQQVMRAEVSQGVPIEQKLAAENTCLFTEYWNAKKWRALAELDTRQVFSIETLKGYGWITNKAWMGDPADPCQYSIKKSRIVPLQSLNQKP